MSATLLNLPRKFQKLLHLTSAHSLRYVFPNLQHLHTDWTFAGLSRFRMMEVTRKTTCRLISVIQSTMRAAVHINSADCINSSDLQKPVHVLKSHFQLQICHHSMIWLHVKAALHARGLSLNISDYVYQHPISSAERCNALIRRLQGAI